MNRTILSFCTCAAIITGAAATTRADQIQFLGMGRTQLLNIRHNGSASNEYMGELLLNITQGGVTSPAVAYCVDLDNDAVSTWTATKQPDTIIDTWSTSGAGKKIGFLFDAFAATATTNTKAAALQAAIWELLDDSGTTLDIRNGTFKLVGTDSTTNAVATQATNYLAALPANLNSYVPSSYIIYSDASPRSQHMIVPEPASLMLLALAIPATLLRRRRSVA